MNDFRSASVDPIFFMHHAFVDKLWWDWQNSHPGAGFQYPGGQHESQHMPGAPMLNIQVGGRRLSNADGYSRQWHAMINYLPSPSTGFGCQPPLLRQTGRGCMASTRIRRPPPPPPRRPPRPRPRPWRPFRGWQPPQRQVPWWQRQQEVRRQWQAPRRQNVWNQWSRPRGLWFKRKKRSTYSQALLKTHKVHGAKIVAPITSHVVHDVNYPKVHKPIPVPVPHKAHVAPVYLPATSDPEPCNDHSCLGFSVQNDFRVNCHVDNRLWAFMAVRIVHVRPSGKVYNSYPMSGGKIDYTCDIYNFTSKLKGYIEPENPPCYRQCKEDESGVFQVSVKSNGMNYRGSYVEYAYLDNRLPIDSKILYIGFKKPGKTPTKVFFSSFDHCGRICRAKCLVPGSHPAQYKPCSGYFSIDAHAPRSYGDSISDAILNHWNFKSSYGCPTPRGDNVDIVFYCDYKTKWW